jgi:hypothetical protein
MGGIYKTEDVGVKVVDEEHTIIGRNRKAI